MSQTAIATVTDDLREVSPEVLEYLDAVRRDAGWPAWRGFLMTRGVHGGLHEALRHMAPRFLLLEGSEDDALTGGAALALNWCDAKGLAGASQASGGEVVALTTAEAAAHVERVWSWIQVNIQAHPDAPRVSAALKNPRCAEALSAVAEWGPWQIGRHSLVMASKSPRGLKLSVFPVTLGPSFGPECRELRLRMELHHDSLLLGSCLLRDAIRGTLAELAEELRRGILAVSRRAVYLPPFVAFSAGVEDIDWTCEVEDGTRRARYVLREPLRAQSLSLAATVRKRSFEEASEPLKHSHHLAQCTRVTLFWEGDYTSTMGVSHLMDAPWTSPTRGRALVAVEVETRRQFKNPGEGVDVAFKLSAYGLED